jgi:FdhE protein
VSASILQPGHIEPPAGEIPFIHVPLRGEIFSERATRLRQLAAGHTMQDFLLFMAAIVDAQQAALNTFPSVPLPSATQLTQCREHGMPPLAVQTWPRDPAWQDALRKIAARVKAHATLASQETLARLAAMDGVALEKLAHAVLSGEYAGMELAAIPFIAAALQVYWTHMTTTLGAQAFARIEVAHVCPVCSSSPSSSMVHGGAQEGLRYLNCALCGTRWHMVRVKCSNCESTKDISYYMIDGASPAVKAETCEECASYLKIMYMNKDPHVDPVADDLATLALDLMMDEQGKLRSGPNLFLIADSSTTA